MANKRNFKKNVESVGISLCDEIMLKSTNNESVSKATDCILSAVKDAKANANKIFGKSAKNFDSFKSYKKAKGEFFKVLFDKNSQEFSASIENAMKILNTSLN